MFVDGVLINLKSRRRKEREKREKGRRKGEIKKGLIR
jgi:hypothetical protein